MEANVQRQVALKSEGCDERPRFKAFRGGYYYRQKKQTVKDDSLSGFAPQVGLEPTTP